MGLFKRRVHESEPMQSDVEYWPPIEITTTHTIPNVTLKLLGLVSGTAVVEANALKDAWAGIKGITGGRVKFYEEESRTAREHAMNDMIDEARPLGATDIIAVYIIEGFGGADNSALMVTVYGTAAKRLGERAISGIVPFAQDTEL